MKLFHGTHTPADWQPHIGLCLVEWEGIAQSYADAYGDGGQVYEINIPDDLNIVDIDGYDHDENDAPGDDGQFPEGADIIRFEDEDIYGGEHVTYRVASKNALASITWQAVKGEKSC